jgi:GTPase SAR1 family protein
MTNDLGIRGAVSQIPKQMKILILGHAEHGKTTVANIIRDEYHMNYKDSSMAAAEIFLYEKLKPTFKYKSIEECYEDRRNHRALWHEEIAEYNKKDPARLAREIMKDNDIYCGMRSQIELDATYEEPGDGMFDLVIGVYDNRKPLELVDSFKIDLWKACDVIIPNCSHEEVLEAKVIQLFDNLEL